MDVIKRKSKLSVKSRLRVSEIFYSVQGEGPTTGYPAIFIRLALCNLKCEWCDSLLKGTLVLTDTRGWQKIEDVDENELVVGVEKEKNHPVANRWFYKRAKANNLVSHKESEAITIKTTSNNFITTTLNHLFLVKTKKASTNYTFNKVWDWKEAKHLEIGDELWEVGTPNLFNNDNEDYINGWLYGYDDGDGGWSSGDKKVRRYETIEDPIKDRVVLYLQKMGYEPRIYKRKIKNGDIWRIDFKPKDIKYPIRDSIEWKRGYVAGLFDAEGSNNSANARIDNNNLLLLESCKKYLESFGFKCSIIRDKEYSLNILGGVLGRFKFDATFLYAKNHRNKWLWGENGRRGAINNSQKQAKQITKITSIEKQRGDFEFFDIGSSCENYIANGIVVHNTPYTWDWETYNPEESITLYSVKELVEEIEKISESLPFKPIIVVTGGEPLLQQKLLIDFLNQLKFSGYDWIEIETNGTITPSDELVNVVNSFNISPKLSNSNNNNLHTEKPKAMTRWSELADMKINSHIIWKFVVSNKEDIKEIDSLIERYNLYIEDIYLMPEGNNNISLKDKFDWVVEICKQRGFKFCNRLHVLIWGNEKCK